MSNKIKLILICIITSSIVGGYSLVYAGGKATFIPFKQRGYRVNMYSDLIPNDPRDSSKVVLITIDDGPSKRSSEIMKILTKHNAKAIFFINGVHNHDAHGALQDEAINGFTIGNHTWSHLNLKKEKDKNIIKSEISNNSDLINKLTGTSPRFFRPPYGESSEYVRELVKKDGMIFMNWSGAALDWEKSAQDEKVFLNNVMSKLHDGEIILIHEHPWTVKYLDKLLTEIENKGYTFLDPSQITE